MLRTVAVNVHFGPTIALTTPFKPADERAASEEIEGPTRENELDDEDDRGNWLSVAAIEAELKPKIIEAFDNIAGTYKRLRRLQDRGVQFQLRRMPLSLAQERNYGKLKNQIISRIFCFRAPKINFREAYQWEGSCEHSATGERTTG